MDYTRGLQSAMSPQGPHAEAVSAFAWTMFCGAAVIFALVLALAAFALLSPRPWRRWMSGTRFVVYAGIVLPSVVLVALFAYSIVLARNVAAGAAPALTVEIVGHQWWWRVRYLDVGGAVDFETANELRLPVGRPVALVLASADVIHSFWVPSLAGKLDMIPGHTNRLRVTASRAGVMRGQCAEYCGGPHALMALYAIAQAAPDFERWRDEQRAAAAAPPPGAPDALRGGMLFARHCAACHTVRGTQARGDLGPDLTHVASRISLGAGILAMNRGNLAGWIADAQHIKPGNLMPSMNVLSGEDLRALTAYVEALR